MQARFGRHGAVWLQAVFFGLAHAGEAGTALGNVLVVLAMFTVGVVLGYTAMLTRAPGRRDDRPLPVQPGRGHLCGVSSEMSSPSPAVRSEAVRTDEEPTGTTPGTSGDVELHQETERHHRTVQHGWARAAVFGVSDGLVTNLSLILGVAGAQPGAVYVKLAGFAGLLAGAFSMAAGEYVSMSAQRELLQRELEVERRALLSSPEAEFEELGGGVYEKRGLPPDDASYLAKMMMRTPEWALEAHGREEIGVDPSSLGLLTWPPSLPCSASWSGPLYLWRPGFSLPVAPPSPPR